MKLNKQSPDFLSSELSKRQCGYGSCIEEFLGSIYLAGADIGGSSLEDDAKSIERSNKLPTPLNPAVGILRNRHKHGEQYYWILYYSYPPPRSSITRVK